MSTFAYEIAARCIREAVQTQGTEAHADLAYGIGSALALTIALQTRGNPAAAKSLLRVLVDGLPEMVERRCKAVRESLVEGLQ